MILTASADDPVSVLALRRSCHMSILLKRACNAVKHPIPKARVTNPNHSREANMKPSIWRIRTILHKHLHPPAFQGKIMAWLIPVAYAGVWAVSQFLGSGRSAPNPTYAEIEARKSAERERDRAIRELDSTRAQVTQLVQSMQSMQSRTLQFQQEAISAAAAAQRKTQEQMRAMFDAERAANAARFAAENAARLATEEAKKKAQEAEAERQRTQAAFEKVQRTAEVLKQHAERLQRAAEEEKRKADEAVAEAEVVKQAAENNVREATAAKEDAERRLREGIQPILTPTPQEIRAAQEKIQYQENLFHFAVAGRAGGGKSSLVNAFRGMSNRAAGSARTGVTETTLTMGRYPDSDERCQHIWYDLPGAGTIRIPDWQYFNAQGLYVFDCIVVLFDNRFTQTDIAILLNCRRFKIPTYIVRSKADQHIRNIIREIGEDSDDETADRSQRSTLYMTAREKLVNETRRNVKENLAEANLPAQKVYVVSSNCLRAVSKGEQPSKVIDEIQLLNDLYTEAQARRTLSPSLLMVWEHQKQQGKQATRLPKDSEMRFRSQTVLRRVTHIALRKLQISCSPETEMPAISSFKALHYGDLASLTRRGFVWQKTPDLPPEPSTENRSDGFARRLWKSTTLLNGSPSIYITLLGGDYNSNPSTLAWDSGRQVCFDHRSAGPYLVANVTNLLVVSHFPVWFVP
ncbi:interferon-inducible GTPase-domain-containing protein [Suillus bovinus]|uniref:interferon-inducible GTPase-domain-containing protein n=1 Tax=Suillus bovinus TaxID=48563 RepID=UPI001B87F5D2|nr:interferon-inducible GTPase-domain-containing protein [Suillus bovinus]KAG2130616.1 interferon-inducible GTPase-domain-containing protein [Suillus bovinus]